MAIGTRKPPQPAPKKPPPPPAIEVLTEIDGEPLVQGSQLWKELHIGVPSASRFGTIMANGKDGGASVTRRKLLYAMAGEILTGRPRVTYRNAAMDRGIEMEPVARAFYARTRFVELQEVGFVRRKFPTIAGSFTAGCSPDALVAGQRKALEIKTAEPDILIDIYDRGAGGFPGEHKAQLQGTLWILDYDEIDLLMFYDGMPIAPSFTIERDEPYIARLAHEVETFEWELRALVERLRRG